jgi:hypothetical protein
MPYDYPAESGGEYTPRHRADDRPADCYEQTVAALGFDPRLFRTEPVDRTAAPRHCQLRKRLGVHHVDGLEQLELQPAVGTGQ